METRDKNEMKYKWRYQQEQVKNREKQKIIRSMQAQIWELKESLRIVNAAHWRATEAWVKAEERLELFKGQANPAS